MVTVQIDVSAVAGARESAVHGTWYPWRVKVGLCKLRSCRLVLANSLSLNYHATRNNQLALQCD